MRKQSGGVWHVAEIIADDLEDRETGLSKPQRIGLADLAASVCQAPKSRSNFILVI